MGIDPLEAGYILGEDDEDEEHKVYLEERIEYIPERRASQMIIDFDPKANSYKLLVCYPFLLSRLRFHSCTEHPVFKNEISSSRFEIIMLLKYD